MKSGLFLFKQNSMFEQDGSFGLSTEKCQVFLGYVVIHFASMGRDKYVVKSESEMRNGT